MQRLLVLLLSSPFLLLSVAPAQHAAQEHPAPTPTELGLDSTIPWIRDPQVYVDGGSRRGAQPKVDRGALLDKALAQAKIDGKPVLWYVYRVLDKNSRGAQMYRSPVLDTYVQQVLFTDPDVAGIVAARFVPLRMVCDAPLSDRFHFRPLPAADEDTTIFVEPGVVFLDEDGKVIHFVERLRTFDAPWFAEVLRKVLDKYDSGRAGKATPRHLDAAQAIAEGRWEQARAELEGTPERTAQQQYQLATVLRRLRQPREALAALDQMHNSDRGLRASQEAERGVILAMLGDTVAARPHLEGAWKDGGARGAEAGYVLALCTLREGHEKAAAALFGQVAERAPDSPWGKKAKANVVLGNDQRPLGATFSGFEHYGYLADAAYAGLPRDTQWHGDVQAPHDLAVHAVAFLLDQQRDYGGFTDSRYAYWPNPEITPNVWVAITALACTALLEYRNVDPKLLPVQRIDAAIARAEKYMFDPARLNRGKNEDVYADAYRLLYLTRKRELAEPQQRAGIVEAMNSLIEEVAKRQDKNGFWAHEYPNAFCTGAMLWSLELARQAGAEVSEELLSRGFGALESARDSAGGFAYGGIAGKRSTPLKDASPRMPLCEGVLLAGTRGTPERLDFAFATFWKYMERLERIRRNDFHTDGQLGGFFFFHAVFHASEAAKLLPEDKRAAANQKLLALLQSIPELDGSFLDSHELGRSYGTAMALLTLKNVTP